MNPTPPKDPIPAPLPIDLGKHLNVASQCAASATSPLASRLVVDNGSGLLKELLLDASSSITEIAQTLADRDRTIAELLEAMQSLVNALDECQQFVRHLTHKDPPEMTEGSLVAEMAALDLASSHGIKPTKP